MGQKFTAEEYRILREGRASNQPAWVIAGRLNLLPSNTTRGIVRRASGVNFKLRNATWASCPDLVPEMGPEVEEISTFDRHHDDLFQQRMSAAIARGVEHAHVGVKKDNTPFTGRMIHAEPIFSGCSSSALLCAENGAPDSRSFTDSF